MPSLAMVADVKHNTTDFNGNVVALDVREFIIQVDSYPFATVDEGDVVIMEDLKEYAVSRVDGDKWFKYADETNLAFRIFTNLISE